eukprot:CAMPEP_0118921134 /NCGR_PEP_ID=MMETSP1169-20130426/509_1 /TAXON_ID=36882 /ORGANISM="Pyramimonas obovata, Strain CCMP722" /LENGTH=271 /DNA_ID=CAMNT_0006861803 /DNA_START=186 /DNA_END=1001 /DNA_ORIENTATION=-
MADAAETTAPEAPAPEAKETPAPAAVPAFGFGAAGVGLGTAAPGTGFQFGSFSAFSATPSPPLASTSTEDDAADAQEECKADFAPIVQLDVVDVVTGEESEDVLHEVKAKLYRFDSEKSEWKERGLGIIKLLEHKETKKARLLMRREKTLKICCNQYVARSVKMDIHPGNEKSLGWTCNDFSDGEVKLEVLCIRFGSVEKAAAFKAAYEEAQKKLPADGAADEGDDDAEEEADKEEEAEEEEEGEEKPSAEADKLASELEGATVEDKKEEA